MSTHTLHFMGERDLDESFRCRVYVPEDGQDDERYRFLAQLADGGVIDCPAYDKWIAALDDRGWLRFEWEPVEGGRYKRWFLNDCGLEAWEGM